MHVLPENSKRRESIIAGLSAAIVGLAMIAVAGKASAVDQPIAHDHATTATASMAKAPEGVGEGDATELATDPQASDPDHATHQGHPHPPTARRGDEHDLLASDTRD